MLVRAALSASLVAATALGQSFEWRRAQVDHFATCHLAFDTARNRLVALADFLHEWDGHQWVRLTAANTPSAIRDSQLAYDSLRQRLVLLQFTAGSNVIFEYDGSIWTQPPMGATTPTPRIPAAMAFDAALGMVVIFGGRPVPVPSVLGGRLQLDAVDPGDDGRDPLHECRRLAAEDLERVLAGEGLQRLVAHDSPASTPSSLSGWKRRSRSACTTASG